MSGSEISSVIAHGECSRGQRQGRGSQRRHQDLEARFAPHFHHDAREGQIVVDHQEHAIAVRDRVAVIADFIGERPAVDLRLRHGDRRRSFEFGARHDGRHAGRRRLCQWQIQGERTAATRRAGQSDFAAEQARDLATDRQAQAGAAVLTARATVGLLEGLEDDLLLVAGDADAGIGHGDRHHRLGAVEAFVFRVPARGDEVDVERDAAAMR